MKHIIKVSVLLLMLISVTMPMGAEVIEVSNDDISISLEITNAYYTDYEGDGLENDIIADYQLNATFYKTQNNDYKYTFHVIMVLPSGYSFSYSFDRAIPAENNGEFYSHDFRLVMPDHALESGWYNLTSGIEIYQWGHTYGDMTITFDPPETETGNTLPPPLIEQ